MTAEQLEELAGGENPAHMDLDLDQEEIITHLANRVIAAEKLVEAIEGVTHYITGYAGSDEQDALDTALTAYREASK